MTKKTLKRAAAGTVFTFVFLSLVLCIHIYLVTRPKAPSANSVAMARIDIKQPINQSDAAKITGWLYTQPGVDHVLCNPTTDIVVFTFKPAQTNANAIVQNFKTALNYKAERFMPSEEEMKNGCPVMANNSLTGKVYSFFKNI
jgi:hypothetical protein